MSPSPDGTDGTAEASASTGSRPLNGFDRDVLALVPALRRYSQSLSRSNADGEDLLQDCIEKVLSSRGQWRGINLSAWAYRIMTNLHRNGYRKSARWPSVDIDAVPDMAAPADDNDPLERKRMRAALDALSPDNRAVLMLVVLEGHSYQEVAKLLDIPIGTVMSRLSRARKQLAERLRRDNIITLRRPK